MSRGMSNCNPGNIRRSRTRYKGEVRPSRDPEFKQFASLEWGYRAIFVLLHTYRVRYGLGSLDGVIARWAPPRPLPPLRGRTDGAEGRRAARYFVPGDDASPGGGHLAHGERGGGAARGARTGLGALPRRFSRIGGAGFRPGSASAGLRGCGFPA